MPASFLVLTAEVLTSADVYPLRASTCRDVFDPKFVHGVLDSPVDRFSDGTHGVEPLIVARLVRAGEEQSGPTERMLVPAESVDDSLPAERLDLDVAFGQPQGVASSSAA
jgi:hypothetical protein